MEINKVKTSEKDGLIGLNVGSIEKHQVTAVNCTVLTKYRVDRHIDIDAMKITRVGMLSWCARACSEMACHEMLETLWTEVILPTNGSDLREWGDGVDWIA